MHGGFEEHVGPTSDSSRLYPGVPFRLMCEVRRVVETTELEATRLYREPFGSGPNFGFDLTFHTQVES